MKRTLFLAVAVVFCTGANVWPQYDPVPGSDELYELFSPFFLAYGVSVASTATPAADSINPASSGFTQRPGADLNYLALVDFGDQGWGGNVLNVAGAVPTAYGVFGGSLHIIRSGLADFPLGTIFALNATAAKDLYPELAAGIGLRTLFGRADQFDIGVALDLGVLHTPGTVGRLSNVRWGATLQNAGRWMTPVAGAGGVPAPFTPQFSFQFDPVVRDRFQLTTGTTLSFPSFQNVKSGVGLTATLFDRIRLNLGWRVDLRQLIEADWEQRSMLPSFGIEGRFQVASSGTDGFIAERGWQQSELSPTVAAAPLYNGVWAIGAGTSASLGMIDFEPPAISVDSPRTLYISPNNDGVKDAAVFPLRITDDRYVAAWRAVVADAENNPVSTIENIDERPENRGFQNLADRILAVDSGVTVPQQIRWSGIADSGERVADGRYHFTVTAWDDNGNSRRTEEFLVVVDTQPPEISLQAGDPERSATTPIVFSPNGDGNKDSLRIEQRGSTEDRWVAEFRNVLGSVVRTRRWDSSAPQSFSWEGRTDASEVVPDGVYQYVVTSTDRAGNATTVAVDNIVVDTATTPITLDASTAWFSPNGDGRSDSITYTPTVPIARGVRRWALTIRDDQARVVRTYTDVRVVPPAVTWNGLDDQRRPLPEGVYSATLLVTYENGNQPTATAPPVAIDRTPPSASVRVDDPVFSPNGDGVKDTATVFQEASREERWTATVRNEAGTIIRSFTWPEFPEQTVTWDGRDNDGRFVPDGLYIYALQATDRAGNRDTSNPATIRLDTSETPVLIRAEYAAFSPNSDGLKDRQQLVLRTGSQSDISSYTIEVHDSENRLVRAYDGRGTVEEAVTWDGTTAEGMTVPDGTYRATFRVVYANGNTSGARTAGFLVDTTPPEVTLTPEYLLFSPDGDGRKDTVAIAQDSSSEDLWSATIQSTDGATIRSYLWRGTVSPVIWDGTDPAGNRVPDGVYTYSVSATDAAGNTASRRIERIVVDTRATRLFLTTSTRAFSPNGDGIRDSFELSAFAGLTDGADRWTLDIVDSEGTPVLSRNGTSVPASQTFAWDGRDQSGRIREGTFTAVYRVSYAKGNLPEAVSSPFSVDVSPPVVAVDLDPSPFSPDNDGVDDQLRIGIEVQEQTDIQAWRLEILDRNNRFFTEFVGRGMPARELAWDGRASDGELVISAEDYPYVLTMSDTLGNFATVEGVIPVDILVVRDGDRLKVQIPSITFEPDSPMLVTDPEDPRGAKNQAILTRLSEVFTKYGNYNVRIEGHAVNVSGTEQEELNELQPLSTARAQSVKDALVELGVTERRISVLGRGGTEPIVPHTDMDNRWKNRRVEFVLIR